MDDLKRLRLRQMHKNSLPRVKVSTLLHDIPSFVEGIHVLQFLKSFNLRIGVWAPWTREMHMLYVAVHEHLPLTVVSAIVGE